MKKSFIPAALILTVCLCLTMALAAGGDASDPLVSLAYLRDFFSKSVDESVTSRLNEADSQLREDLQQQLDTMTAAVEAATGQNFAPAATEAMLKEGDVLTGPTGLTVVPLAGSIRLDTDTGSVVDVSNGQTVAPGTVLSPQHRYIVAEGTVARFTVTSPVAALTYEGNYAFSLSQNTPDYYAIAQALRELTLFRGTGTGYAQGFDLHLAPTRGQGLVMFIRILGEEQAALSCSFRHPFNDVPDWLDPYVAWAYQQGYSNGISATQFGTDLPIKAFEYEEFLLRALGYSVAGVHDYTTSLERALEYGALTNGEYTLLTEGQFLRAQVAYTSYYSLDMILSGSQITLAQRLLDSGVFSYQQLIAARSAANSFRLP